MKSITKLCKECLKKLPIENFSRTPGGYDCTCKKCRYDRIKELKAEKRKGMKTEFVFPAKRIEEVPYWMKDAGELRSQGHIQSEFFRPL